MKTELFFSHKTDIWSTPSWIYNPFLDNGYFDPCPIDPTYDGLSLKWPKKVYCNPPYSDINSWVNKSIEAVSEGSIVYLLIPCRTDTKYFKKLFENGCFSFIFITGRLKFGGSSNSAPFPSVLVFGSPTNKRCMLLLSQNELKDYLNIHLS